MIRLVALDIAGTTVDEGGAVYAALHHAVTTDELNADAPVLDPDAVRPWMGTTKRVALRELTRLASGRDASSADLDRMYGSFHHTLTAAYAETPPAPVPGAPELFDRLRADGVKVALTTGFSHDIADPLLASLGWSVGGNLDALVCSDEVPAGRPAPYLIFRAMERTGVTAVAEVLAAGDTLADLRAGRNAGVRAVVGVTTGKLGYADLAVEEHTHLLPSVAALPEVLSRL